MQIKDIVLTNASIPNAQDMDKNPAAVALGKIRSEKKAKAARENGKKGGRPKKKPVENSPSQEERMGE